MSFFKDFIYLFIFETGEGKEIERERNDRLSLMCTLTGDLAQNPGMCPDWELNWQPFSLPSQGSYFFLNFSSTQQFILFEPLYYLSFLLLNFIFSYILD